MNVVVNNALLNPFDVLKLTYKLFFEDNYLSFGIFVLLLCQDSLAVHSPKNEIFI